MTQLCHDRGIRPHVFNMIPRNLENAVDLGFGFGEFGVMVRARSPEIKRFVGVDIYQPYCENMRKIKLYDEVVCGDVVKYLEGIDWRPQFALCTEVAEHITRNSQTPPKDRGGHLLDLIAEKCEKALIATPLDWVPVRGGIDGNDASQHVSTYTVDDFTKRGYKYRVVHQMNLPRFLQTPYRVAARLAGKYAYRHIFAWKGY